MSDIERLHTNPRMSKIVRSGELVFLCGQTASGSASAAADITAQTHEVLSRVDGLLAQAESDRTRMLSATIYLKHMEDFEAMNAVWEAWIVPGTAPARTTVQAQLASPGLRVEITVTALSRVDASTGQQARP